MNGLILLISTITFCFYFFRVKMPWMISIPLVFFIIYSAERIVSFSGWGSKKDRTKHIWRNYGGSLGWIITMLGIIYLGYQQGLPRYTTSIMLLIINISARVGSFARGYTMGEYIFIQGGRAVSLSLIIQSIRQNPAYTGRIAIIVTTIWQIFYRYRLHQETNTETKSYFLTSKEVCNHIWRYSIIGTIVLPDRGGGLVLAMAYNAIILSLYDYSHTLETYTQQPQKIIHPRDILRGKTFHDAEARHQNIGWGILTRLYRQGRVPSGGGVQFLQCTNIIALVGLLLWTAVRYFQYSNFSTMLWYRGGVICFVIALIATHRESYRYHWYKKIALIIAVTALYVTMLPLGLPTVTIIIISVLRQILHIGVIIGAPTLLDQYGITANDRLFWLSGIIICTTITIIYLLKLPIGKDSIFALACIIIGLIAFLAYQTVYQIRKVK